MFNVTDANGKKFEFTLDQLQDLNANVFNSNPHKVSSAVDLTDHVIPVVDEKGIELGKVGDVSLLVDSKTGQLPKALKVSIETTHSGDNENYALYHSDSMENDAASFIAPYKKPLIKNHDSRTEPLGRAVDTVFKQSDICPDRDTILVDFLVNDKDAIEKFLDGRYRTVSIGGSVSHIKCNICGKDILKDKKVKFCGHWRGEKYGDNVALWHMRDIKYNECSVVNNPADCWAQVVKIVALSDESAKDQTTEETEPTKPVAKDNTGVDDIDKILNENQDNQQENDDNQPKDGKDLNNEDNNDNNDNTEGDNNPPEETIDSLKEEIETLKQQIEQKDEEISTLKVDIDDFKDKLQEAESKFEDNKVLLDEANVKKDEYKKISVNLANLNKKMLVDKVLEMKASEQIEDELIKLSASELKDMIENFKPSTTKNIPKVPNPSLVNPNDTNSINEETDEKEEKDNNPNDSSEYNEKNKNVINSIINNLCK